MRDNQTFDNLDAVMTAIHCDGVVQLPEENLRQRAEALIEEKRVLNWNDIQRIIRAEIESTSDQ